MENFNRNFFFFFFGEERTVFITGKEVTETMETTQTIDNRRPTACYQMHRIIQSRFWLRLFFLNRIVIGELFRKKSD